MCFISLIRDHFFKVTDKLKSFVSGKRKANTTNVALKQLNLIYCCENLDYFFGINKPLWIPRLVEHHCRSISVFPHRLQGTFEKLWRQRWHQRELIACFNRCMCAGKYTFESLNCDKKFRRTLQCQVTSNSSSAAAAASVNKWYRDEDFTVSFSV